MTERGAKGWKRGARVYPNRSVAYLNNSDEVRGMNRASWQREVTLLSGGTIVDETVTNSETVETVETGRPSSY